MRTLFKNAKLVFSDETVAGNMLIEGQRIVDLFAVDDLHADRVIDVSGRYLLPGVIDDQVHFREPGLTHKEDLWHATRAAAKGGVTSFLEMPNTVPTTTSQQRLDEKLALAAERCLVNYGFYIGATPHNLVELKNAKRTPGIKIFIGSSTGDLLVDDQAALERIFAETSLPICAHCEDESTVRANQEKFSGSTDVATHSLVRDARAAYIATERAIDLAVRHRHQFHILHVSTAAELELIAAAPEFITAEVCPHHLFFSVDDYSRLGSLVKMNPSIKSREDNARLWDALLDGTIDLVATDHAPHTWDEKQLPYPQCPSGLPAVENFLALFLDRVNAGECTLNQIARWMCEAPARVWHLKGKGKLEIGADADFCIIDMELTQTIRHAEQQTKSRWSPWDGETLTGWSIETWVMGQKAFELVDGQPKFANTPLGQEIEFDR